MALEGHSNNYGYSDANNFFSTQIHDITQRKSGSPSVASEESDLVDIGFARVLNGEISLIEPSHIWFPGSYLEPEVVGPNQPEMPRTANPPNEASISVQVEVSKRMQKIGQGQWACRECSMTFKRKDRAVAHVNQHLGLYNFPCHGQCGDKYCTKSTFVSKEYLRSHCCRRDTRCSLCPDIVVRRKNIARHMRRVHPDIPKTRNQNYG
ncbi:hypothetical protein CPB86DRAFT_787096 [Serendipita vermifera]|nr:hypothetical protein CPB86DRAFT_787096 [Serendipita vermifera]